MQKGSMNIRLSMRQASPSLWLADACHGSQEEERKKGPCSGSGGIERVRRRKDEGQKPRSPERGQNGND